MVARLYPIQPPEANQYIPRGRYIFTIMLPTLWLIALGWQGLLPTRWKPYGPIMLLGVWAAIDLLAWGAIIGHFYAAV
jgi:hypothetical protein